MGHIEIIAAILSFVSFVSFFWLLRRKSNQEDMVNRVKSASIEGQNTVKGVIDRHSLNQAYEAGVSDIFDVSSGFRRSVYKIKFEQAGWNPKDAPQTIILTKILLSMALVVPAIFLVMTVGKLQQQTAGLKALIILGAALGGFLLFDKFMNIIINRRYNRISRDLHSAVELLVVCSKAGMGIEKGLERVALELSQYNPDLGREFLLTAIELEVIPNRKVAYENLRRRVSLPLVQGMTTTLIQAEEQGSSVSDSLRVLSEEFRSQVLLNFERKAAKLPATLSIPVVLFTLPTLMAVVLGPMIIKLMNESSVFG
jgi:tight adherence protein C